MNVIRNFLVKQSAEQDSHGVTLITAGSYVGGRIFLLNMRGQKHTLIAFQTRLQICAIFK